MYGGIVIGGRHAASGRFNGGRPGPGRRIAGAEPGGVQQFNSARLGLESEARVTASIDRLSAVTEALLGPPFEWCPVSGGPVTLTDARQDGGTAGGILAVA